MDKPKLVKDKAEAINEEAYIRRANMTAEEELQIARERFNVIFQNTSVSIWDYYFASRQIVQPTRSQQLHGFDFIVENVPDSLIESGYVHADSAAAFREMYAKLFAGAKQAEGIFRVQTVDRTGYWYEHIHYHTLFDEHGVPYAAVGMSTDVTNEMELQKQAQGDALTGLLNKKSFGDRAQNMLSRFPEQIHTLISIDLDNFKDINDTYGHDSGDTVLCRMAAILRENMAEFSVSGLAARVGGDEFAVLLNNADKNAAAAFAHKLCAALRCNKTDGISLTCSMGVALYPQDGDSLKRLLVAADRALYYVKRQDKDGFSFYGDSNGDSTLQIQRRQQFLSDNISGGMMGSYIEPDYPLYFIDESLLAWLGYANQDEFAAAIDGLTVNCVHPDDRPIVLAELGQQLAAKGRYAINYRIRSKAGGYLWFNVVGEKTIAPDGREAIVSVCYDISAEKEHRDLLNNLLTDLDAQVALYQVYPGIVLRPLQNSRTITKDRILSSDE